VQSAATNIEGFKHYAKDGETALMSPVFNPQALAQNIIKLIEDDELRIKIAKAGNENIKQFSMDKVYNKIDKLFLQNQ
jgi:glycosyltransferase involved in cell wall biosynthesis